ncbi:hypothetical protein ACQ4PT_042470 [Festuca glaucescens]
MGLVGRRRGAAVFAAAATAVALMQIVLLVMPTGAQQSNGTSRVVPAEGYCSMYGICAHRSDGKVLNCANSTKAVKLWVSPGSQTADEKQYFDSHLAPFYRIEQLVLATSASDQSEAPTIVNDNNLKLLFQIQKKIDDLRANYSGSVVSLADICLKPLNTDCATQSVLQYFQLDPKNYEDLGIDHAKFCFQHYSSDVTCLSTFQSPVDPSTVLGGFPGSNFTEASAFVITYPVNNKVEKTGQENEKAMAWERAYINLVKEEILPMVLAQNLTLSFSSESSIKDELHRESTADAITIVISYIVMFAYISFTLGDRPSRFSSLFVSSKDVHGPILGYRAVKFIVIAVFVGFAFASIGYFNDLEKYLKVGPPLYFVVKDFNYSSASENTNQICSINQCNSNSLLNEIARQSLSPETSYIAKPAASWLDDFLVWMSPEAFGCCRKFVSGNYCPPDDQPPCCEKDSGSCNPNGVCSNCTTCFLHSDLHNGRPSTTQFKEKLPWFLDALPSSDCSKGGKGAYSTSLDLSGYENGIIQASAFRTYHTPLNKQADYVNSMRAARDFSSQMSKDLQMQIFPYSVFYIFFEQYLSVWKTAIMNICVCLGTVFIVCFVVTSSLWASTIILIVLAMIVLDLMGVMAVLGIQLNAISIVNLVMSIGIAVEFCVHITHAFMTCIGDRENRARQALSTMGASVFSGITLTKLVGVIVLRFAKSEVFVVYYFQMYLALVLIGFLHGLIFLPVVLSLCGPPEKTMKPIEQSQTPPSNEQT